MTQTEISTAIDVKTGGTLSKLLENLMESGIIRAYPRYGKERVETVYQLIDFFSLFYLRFIQGKQAKKGICKCCQSVCCVGQFVFRPLKSDAFSSGSPLYLQNNEEPASLAGSSSYVHPEGLRRYLRGVLQHYLASYRALIVFSETI